MEKLKLYRKRSRQFYYSFIVSTTILFLACLPLYFYFKLPLHPQLVYSLLIIILLLGLLSLSLAYFLKRKLFPVNSSKDIYWSYTATRRYFWLFSLVLVPFFLSFIFFIIFAPLSLLFLGYILSLCGLILIRPREEDLI